MSKILFFDIGYTLVDESAVWQKRCEEQAATEEAQCLGLSAEAIWQEIEEDYKRFCLKRILPTTPLNIYQTWRTR